MPTERGARRRSIRPAVKTAVNTMVRSIATLANTMYASEPCAVTGPTADTVRAASNRASTGGR